MKIIGALLARDEASPDRYLERSIRAALELCDEVVVLDDNSTDKTGLIAHEIDPKRVIVVTHNTGDGFWGDDETTPRAKLWDLAAREAGDDGWILVFDADMELLGISRSDLLTCCSTEIYNSWAMPLYDCWNDENLHRVDGYWIGWANPRVWLAKAKPTPDFVPEWDAKSIHAGHLPHNFPIFAGVLPDLTAWRHCSYIQVAHRLGKANQYMSLGEKLSEQEMAHAVSITDENPTVVPIPSEKITRILCGVPIRKPPVVLNALMQTLAWQRFRNKVQMDFLFMPNFADSDPFYRDSMALLEDAKRDMPGDVTIAANVPNPGNDYGDGSVNRQWTKPAFERLAQIKNYVIQEALRGGYDYLFLLDADVFCEPFTVQSLLDSANHERYLVNPNLVPPVVAGVYWTDWQWHYPESTDRVHCGPQVWLRHPYQLDGRGWTETDFRSALVNRQRVQVGGLGACTLIPRGALAKGLNFDFVDGLPAGPMSEGEDRHFCERANRLHIPMFADPWPDIYHAYHPQEYDKIPEMLSRLARNGSPPSFGDLVSARVDMLEPVADQFGRVFNLEPEWIRGRLGQMKILPQIEEMLGQMQPGTSRVVRLHYPASYTLPQLSLQKRLARLTLYDAKPFKLPPVIDREFMVGGASGRLLDTTTMTQEQLEEIADAE